MHHGQENKKVPKCWGGHWEPCSTELLSQHHEQTKPLEKFLGPVWHNLAKWLPRKWVFRNWWAFLPCPLNRAGGLRVQESLTQCNSKLELQPAEPLKGLCMRMGLLGWLTWLCAWGQDCPVHTTFSHSPALVREQPLKGLEWKRVASFQNKIGENTKYKMG